MEDDDNPKNVSEIERIKWVISRIDLLHKNMLESTDDAQTIFENSKEKASNKIRSWRRGIFSILGAILTVTFGINSFQPIEIWLSYSILAIVSAVGVLNYFIMGWINSFIEDGFGLIINVTNETKNRIKESQAFVTTQFADLGFLDLTKIKNYGVFTLLLQIAIKINMMNELKKDKSYKTTWVTDTLKEDFKEIKELAKDTPFLYSRFDDTQIFPITCFDLIEKTLKKYRKEEKPKP